MNAETSVGHGQGRRPRRVVALGGGTGLPAVLRGLRRHVCNGDMESLTAVVAMTDDGGSSGRLRRSLGLPPPGDVRNCLVALAEEEDLLSGLFQYRYGGTEELAGHSLGNLILAALTQQTGCFVKAVETSSRVLRTVGRILPATLEDVRLEARLADGRSVVGETRVASCDGMIERISLRPRTARPTPGVIEAIEQADLVVIGPGSLYTSVLPNLVLDGIAAALRRTSAPVVLVANLVSERGEAAGLTLADHLEVIERHVAGPVVDAMLVNNGPISTPMLERYREEGATPLAWPSGANVPVRVIQRDVLAPGPKLRHDPEATAAGLLEAWAGLTASRSVG